MAGQLKLIEYLFRWVHSHLNLIHPSLVGRHFINIQNILSDAIFYICWQRMRQERARENIQPQTCWIQHGNLSLLTHLYTISRMKENRKIEPRLVCPISCGKSAADSIQKALDFKFIRAAYTIESTMKRCAIGRHAMWYSVLPVNNLWSVCESIY